MSLGIDLKNKLLTVVTEGGRTIGFGHITRCLSIGAAFQHYGFKINFIVNADDSVSPVLAKTVHGILDWSHKQQELLNMLQDSSLILIDSIKITNDLILKIQSLNIPVIFIDDERRRNILTNGFVIDWTVLSEKKNYFIPKKKDVLYLLGSQYTPLRYEFINAKKNSIKQNIESIMVTFGGSDVRNLTPNILRTLAKEFPKIKKNIVIGAGFKNIKDIENFKDKNTTLIFNADTSMMINLMQTSDIAIASGGQTLYELARIGTPTIGILLVENAKDDIIGWNKVGSIKNIGWWDDKKLILNLKNTIKILKDKNERQKMQDNAKKYINPNGAELLVKTIIEKL